MRELKAISSRHGIVGRYIHAFYGKACRLAYSLHVRRNMDVFVVYDRQPGTPAMLSAKIVMTFEGGAGAGGP